MAKQHIILVAGFNFMAWPVKPGEKPDGTNFAVFCERRARWLRNRLPHATFSRFDFGDAVLRVSEEDEKGKRTSSKGFIPDLRWVQRKRFTKLTKANFDGHGLKRNPPADMMSITDVYDYVRRLGRGEKDVGSAGTLIELSFFSHGHHEGSILVNSNDLKKKEFARDPDDKDPRHQKDFLSKEERAAFKKAFAKSGVVWVWGCNRTSDYAILFEKLRRTPKYKQKAPGKLPDDQLIEFDATTKDEWLYRKHNDVFTVGRTERTFESTIRKITAFYKSGMKDTYMSNVAAAAKITAHGALPGTEAILEGKDGLMAVPSNLEKHQSDQRKLVEFYKTYLNVDVDPEGRFYGQYLPGDTIATSFGSIRAS